MNVIYNENCLDTKDNTYAESTLSEFIELENETDDKEWKKHWIGMPEFVQNDNPSYKKLIVNFRNKEDYAEFVKLIDQKITDKTKSIWYPELDKDQNTLKRWMEIDE